jgi:hypothetical protein
MYLGLYRESSGLTWGQDYIGSSYINLGGISHAREPVMRTVSGCPPVRRSYLEIEEREFPPVRRTYLELKGGERSVTQV